MSYNEKIKLRILNGDLSKPDDLYPELIDEIAKKKDIIPQIINNRFLGVDIESAVDIGGGRGDLINKIDARIKTVVDKREFACHPGIGYIIDEYRTMYTDNTDIAIYSEFLHLFDDDIIDEIISTCRARYIIIIENVFDDFLDLRLRLWSGGRCIDPEMITKKLDVAPFQVNDYYVWVQEINNGKP